jgi:N-acetylneuraminate synthase
MLPFPDKDNYICRTAWVRKNMNIENFQQEVMIANRKVGIGYPCFIIAEIAQAHDGSLGAAHAYIDAVANAGADAIKFQTHIAEAESTQAEAFRVKFSKQDSTRYDYWRRMEFTPEQWQGLVEHCREKGLIFLSSAFSEQAVDLLERLDCPAWKVGSGEVRSTNLLRRMAATGKPVLLSSGMSSWADLEQAIACVRTEGSDLVLFQCTTAYPCPPEHWGLNVIEELRRRFGCPVGFSDHSGNIYAGLAAVALGANLVEVHVTFSYECFGPDVRASVTTADLKRLVDGIRQIGMSLRNPVEKDAMAEELSELQTLFGKSLVAARGLRKGHKLTVEDIVVKKPGIGIPEKRLPEIIGRTISRAYIANELFEEKDIE